MIYDTSNHEKNNIISSILNFWAQEIHSTQETSSKIWMALTCFHLFVSFFYEIFIALDFRFNFLMKGTVDLLYILLDFGRITHFWQEPTNICHDSILFSTFHSRKCLYVVRTPHERLCDARNISSSDGWNVPKSTNPTRGRSWWPILVANPGS